MCIHTNIYRQTYTQTYVCMHILSLKYLPLMKILLLILAGVGSRSGIWKRGCSGYLNCKFKLQSWEPVFVLRGCPFLLWRWPQLFNPSYGPVWGLLESPALFPPSISTHPHSGFSSAPQKVYDSSDLRFLAHAAPTVWTALSTMASEFLTTWLEIFLTGSLCFFLWIHHMFPS